MCAHVWTRDQVNNCGIDGGLALPESSPVLSIIGGTSVCLHLNPLHFGAVTGTPTILVITPLHFGAVTGTPTILVITPLQQAVEDQCKIINYRHWLCIIGYTLLLYFSPEYNRSLSPFSVTENSVKDSPIINNYQ